MTKTFKSGIIFFLSCMLFVCVRIIAQFTDGLSDNLSDVLFTILVQVVCYGIIPTGLYMWALATGGAKERFVSLGDDFCFRKKVPSGYIGIAFAIGAIMYFLNTPIILAWSMFLQSIGYTYTASVGTIYDSWSIFVLQILMTAILPAFFEEYSQRGLLGYCLKDIKSDALKIVLMGLMFGLMHQNIVQTMYTFFGGVIISFMYVKTKSIYPGIIIHFTNNFLSVLFDFSGQQGGVFALLENLIYALLSNAATVVIVIAIWGVLAFLLIRMLRRVHYEAKYAAMAYTAVAPIVSEPQAEAFSDVFGMPKTEAPMELFEIKIDGEEITVRSKPKVWEYAFVIATAVMCLITTVFSLVWGILR